MPRSVWSWATDTFDDRTCEDIWRVIVIRRTFRQRVRRTVFRAGILLGMLAALMPMAASDGNPVLRVSVYALLPVLMLYLINGMFVLQRTHGDMYAICSQNAQKWLAIAENLDPLLAAHRKGDPVVSVLVTFEYPDAS